ncbi:MAG: LarC family nickel insertion protein [Gammaproteobacteria bacterium]|nr:LarC family nickel insertion protein [Gammaproteobacteria bacterium]
MHLHLDPLGGVAGDMFVGALLDLRPALADGAMKAVRAAGLDPAVGLAHRPFSDGILSGSRFDVTMPARESGHEHDHVLHHHHHSGHDHTHQEGHVEWSTLRARLATNALDAKVGARAIDIFTHLAQAEARVHGKSVDAVAFHEVGAWDSIADIVAAAFLIEALGTCTWSLGPLPVGSGRVRSAHGVLPVPAPATALLLEGFACFDDGLPGERVTPTGAAILRHLAPAASLGRAPRRLVCSGHGFGLRHFAGLSNVLRILEFSGDCSHGIDSDQVLAIRFEIDDQTGEDLAVGLDRLRALDGVLDVQQAPSFGKRGRLFAAIQVLARPEMAESVTAACFRETTTIGLRLQRLERRTLERRAARTQSGLRVKIAERPGGATAKAEIADVLDDDDHRTRGARRAAAEAEALGYGDETHD